MKKFLSIILLVSMLFSLTACSFISLGGPQSEEINTNTGTIAGTNTDTATDTSTDSSTNTSTSTNTDVYVPPILDYDAMKYTVKYSKDKKKIYFGNYSFKAPAFTPYYNDYEAAVSMTFDDGADIAAAQVASSIMAKYGIRGTLMVNINAIDGNLAQWQALVNQGVLDIGSHGWAHINPYDITTEQMEHEIKGSLEYLQKNFPNENPLTYATPFAQITDTYEEYLKFCGFISNRLETGGAIIKPTSENINMLRLGSSRIDVSYLPSQVQINVASAIDTGSWFIELFHNIRTSSHSTDLPAEEFEAHCQWLYDNYNGKVWFGSYDDVSKYVAQYQTATIEYTAVDSESMTFTAKVDKNYGQEMTLKIYMPFFIDSAYAIIDGEERYLTVQKESNARSVLINTEISEEGTEIKIVMGGNDKYLNNCTHNYVEYEVVEPTATEYGYTVMYCPNEGCGHTYKEKYTDKVTD